MMSDWTRGTRILILSLGILLAVAVVGSIAFAFTAWGTEVKGHQQSQGRADKIQDQYNKLYKEYTDATGDEPSAPSPTEVKTIAGTPGENGRNGADATDAQVFSAVTTYCSYRGFCIGPKGDASTVPGPAGADSTVPGPAGKDSTVPGPQGIPGESIKGDTGAAGTNGLNGQDGRSVTSIVCTDGAHVVFYDQNGVQISTIQMICIP